MGPVGPAGRSVVYAKAGALGSGRKSHIQSLARTLATRRDNLKETIAALEQRLASIQSARSSHSSSSFRHPDAPERVTFITGANRDFSNLRRHNVRC